MSDTEFTRDELHSLAQEVDISGRSSMTKAELREALNEEAPHMLNPFGCVPELEPGDKVSMSHLSSTLRVTEQQTWHSDEITKRTQDDVVTHEVPEEQQPLTEHIVTVMETTRGGRHALVSHKGAESAPNCRPWKNGDQPHLRRWRAGDEEWMNNSDDPLFIRKIEEADDD